MPLRFRCSGGDVIVDVVGFSLLLLTGLFAGFVGGLLGIGGCSIMLPILVFVYNYSEAVAIGTTITAVVLTALSGALAHMRIGNVDKRTALVVGFAGVAGAAIGDAIFVLLVGSPSILDLVLGFAFLYASLRMVVEGLRGIGKGVTEGDKVPGTQATKAAIGLATGITSGIVGLGGGYLLVPLFIYVLGSPIRIAIGTSLLSFLPLAITSAAPKLFMGQADPLAAIALGLGTIVGAQIGAKLVPKVPSKTLKLSFGIVFLTVSIKFMAKSVGL